MKIVTYLKNGNEQLACFINDYLFDMEQLHPDLPNTMSMFLAYWDDNIGLARAGEQAVLDGRISYGERNS
jgi:fumarylacetoacetate (FAA) hydrolase